MKHLSIAVLSLLSSVSAFAATNGDGGDVILNAKTVSIAASTATVVRTADTPKVVKVYMQVPMGERVCEETGTRMVFGRNPVCGYDTVLRSVWRSYCVRYERSPRGGTRCVAWQRRLETYPVSVMRACDYPVNYCVRYGTATHFETKKVKLVFRKAKKLSGSEQETFLLSGDQRAVDSSNADFTMKPLDTQATYEVKSSDFFGDRIKLKKISDQPMTLEVAPAAGEEPVDNRL